MHRHTLMGPTDKHGTKLIGPSCIILFFCDPNTLKGAIVCVFVCKCESQRTAEADSYHLSESLLEVPQAVRNTHTRTQCTRAPVPLFWRSASAVKTLTGVKQTEAKQIPPGLRTYTPA